MLPLFVNYLEAVSVSPIVPVEPPARLYTSAESAINLPLTLSVTASTCWS